MKRIVYFLLGAALLAPLYLAIPAEAQTLRDIQRLEERVQEAKQRGDWGAVSVLEPQLNQARLQYQRNHGMGEVNDRGYYYPGNGYYYPGNNGAYYPGNNGYYYPGNSGYYPAGNNGYYHPSQNGKKRGQTRGYYDSHGHWRTR
jgi:hypothetical protein